jgi:hypothetical protein
MHLEGFSFMGDNTKEAVDSKILSLRKQLEMMGKEQELLRKEAELCKKRTDLLRREMQARSAANFSPLSKMSVRDISQALPEFDPSIRISASAEVFVKRMTVLAEKYDWDEKILLLAALAVKTKMTGAAKV